VSKESQLADRMVGRETLVVSSPRGAPTAAWRADPRPLVDAGDATVRFADRGALELGTVIWATGFPTDHAWIDVPHPRLGGRGWVKDDAE
jgi:putative flavoprotein involved in K+ transport